MTITTMRKILIAAAMLLGCDDANGEPEPRMGCAELRETIVLECEGESAAVLECAGEDGFPGDCPPELEALNACVESAKTTVREDSSSDEELDVARNLAYFCDLLADEWMCEMIEEDAPSNGVSECPLPERF